MGSLTAISVQSNAVIASANSAPQRALTSINNTKSQTPAEYKKTLEKLQALDSQIDALKGELAVASLSDGKRLKLEEKLEELQAVAKLRNEMADYKVSKDGKTITFTLNDYYTVESFKKAFGLKDGAFREAVGREALSEAGAEGEKGSFESFEAAKSAGVRRFANGVYIEKNWFGVDKVNYSHAILQLGHQYSIDSSNLK